MLQNIAYILIITAVCCVASIITYKALMKNNDKKLMQSQSYQSLFDLHDDGILQVNSEDILCDINASAVTKLGLSKEDLINRPISEALMILDESGQHEDLGKMLQQFINGSMTKAHKSVTAKNGNQRELSLSYLPQITKGMNTGYFLCIHDVTAEKQRELELNYLAYHDELTGLPNRRSFHNYMTRALSKKKKRACAVMLLDIDGFKLINDSYGHAYGDLALKRLSERVSEAIAGLNVRLFRISGDEFCLFCEDITSQKESAAIARQIMKSMEQPYQLDDIIVKLSASIGIASSPQDGVNKEQILHHADMAMYKAKRKGKNSYHFYS